MTIENINTLTSVVKQAIENKTAEIHTALPGQIVSYDASTQTADIQLLIKRKFFDSSVKAQTLPVIPNVPVKHPRTIDAFIHLPIKKGDFVELIFQERSIDKYLASGQIVDPEDFRKHDFRDAIAHLGYYPIDNTFEVTNPDAIEITNKDGKFTITNDGKFLLASSTAELLSEIVDTIGKLSATLGQMVANKTFTMLGPQTITPPDIITVNEIKAQVDAIKVKVEGLKG